MALVLAATIYPFISISNDDDITANPYFRASVVDALAKLASKPIGLALLTAISNAPVAATAQNFKVKIMRAAVNTVTIGNPGIEGGSRAVAFNEINGRTAGAGTPAGCYWNPNIFNTPGGARPNFIGLGHELIHCYHYTNGLAKHGYDQEEEFTVGLGLYAGPGITENALRLEHNVALRNAY